MFKKIILSSLFTVISLVNCGRNDQQERNAAQERTTMVERKILSEQDIYQFFPRTVQEVYDHVEQAITQATQGLDSIIVVPPSNRNFDNTARTFDRVGGNFSTTMDALSSLEMISPDEAIRKACHEGVIKLQQFAVDAFSNKKIYNAFKEYIDSNAKNEQLNAEESYFLQETMRDFKREGLDLPDDQLDEVKKIKKELAQLALEFDTNIATDKSKIIVGPKDLEGLDEHFIKALPQDEQGNYILACNYPIYFEVMDHCTVEETRKRFYFCFNNRAYPQNKELLEKIIAKRDDVAHKLGFSSYSALEIDGKMAQTPERAEKFIVDLATKARSKADKEFEAWKKDLPQGVTLDEKGLFKQWDLSFVKAYYKKKHFNVDERKIAEYFEVDRTLQGVFDIYQKFLSLKFTIHKPSWAWHEDVKLIEVRERDSNVLRGFVFIDLYPRENKFSHACHCGIVHATSMKNQDGSVQKSPSMAIVIANFPRATKDRPALLKHHDVETFFHEFGHAMHYVLGSTELQSFSGTSVKLDFVEMPSQIFEEWMFDKTLLKNLTHHYISGDSLPDQLIDNLVSLKQFDSGNFVIGQGRLSLISLEYFKDGAHKNTDAIREMIAKKYSSHTRFEPDAHFQASFGHLTGYGSKYYGYLWSKVFALDLFYAIKEQGLVNPEAGKIFVDKILAKGGSVDPNILLKDYLGREPGQNAFFKDLGMVP